MHTLIAVQKTRILRPLTTQYPHIYGTLGRIHMSYQHQWTLTAVSRQRILRTRIPSCWTVDPTGFSVTQQVCWFPPLFCCVILTMIRTLPASMGLVAFHAVSDQQGKSFSQIRTRYRPFLTGLLSSPRIVTW